MGRLFSVMAATAVGVVATDSLAQSTYSLVGSFATPQGSSWTVGADGRVWSLDGATIRRQTAINASTYEVVGTLDSSTGPGGRLSISPDGTRLVTTSDGSNVLRSALIANLSTSAPTPTSVTVMPGFAGPNSIGAWSNNQFFIAATAPSSPTNAYFGVLRLDFSAGTTPTTTIAISVPNQTLPTSAIGGPVAIGGGSLYWATPITQGASPDALLRFPIEAVTANTTPATNFILLAVSTATATGLAVDGLGTLVLDAYFGNTVTMTAFSAGGTQAWGTSSGTLQAAGVARPTFNPVTFELLALAPNGSISRFSIPSPTAAGLLGLGALAACRRRR